MNHWGQRCIICSQEDFFIFFKKEKEECAARIICGVQSGGGGQNIQYETVLSPLHPFTRLPLVRKGSPVYSSATFCLFFFLVFCSHFFNLSFSIPAPPAAQVKGADWASADWNSMQTLLEDRAEMSAAVMLFSQQDT